MSITMIGVVYEQNNTVEKTAPCVDGDGDVNLEGIMCSKEVYDADINHGSLIFIKMSGMLLAFIIVVLTPVFYLKD